MDFSNQPQMDPRKKRKNKIILISVIATVSVVAIIAGILFFVFGGNGSSSADSAQDGSGDIYTVTFSLNYSGENKAPKQQNIKKNDKVTVPETPKRDGYFLVGWYEDKECKTIYDFEKPVKSSFTLYAGWQEFNYELAIAQQAISLVYITYSGGDNADFVSGDVVLPDSVRFEDIEEEFDITWHSSDTNVVSENGYVARKSANTDVTLTAFVEYEGETASKDFDLCVVKQNNTSPKVYDNLDEMSELNDGAAPIVHVDENDEIAILDGVYSNVEVNSCNDAIKSLYSIKEILGIDDPDIEFVGSASNKSEYSNTFVLEQVYKGIPVFGRTIVVTTTPEGIPCYMSSGYLNDIDISVTPEIDSDEILTYLTSDEFQNVDLEVAGLSVFSLFEYSYAPVLTYVVEKNDPKSNAVVGTLFVNANTGEIVYTQENVISYSGTTIEGRGRDEMNEMRSFPISLTQNVNLPYQMYDPDRAIKIFEKNMSDSNGIAANVNNWNDKTANSAYANLIVVDEWYINNLNEDLMHDYGRINLIVHSEPAGGIYSNNAAWCGNNTMVFWDNDSAYGWLHTTAAGLDVVAHEYTHGIFQYVNTEYVPYSNEPGAINEAYADVFGCLVDGDWIMGEDVVSGGMRNISNPAATEYPSRYQTDQYWLDYTTDSYDCGGVHINSTVISHAAYLMYQNGFSADELADLWYESMKKGYNGTSKFLNVRLNTIKAGKMMRLSEEKMNIINKAFDAVNIKANYSLSGKITVADQDTDMNNNVPLGGAKVQIQSDDLVKSAITDANGNYKITTIPYGKYTVKVTKDGYIPVSQEFMFDETIQNVYNATIEAVSNENSGVGYASGIIYNVGTGYPVAGMTLNVRSGLNNTTGVILHTIYSNSEGSYTTQGLQAGNYTIEVVDERANIGEDEEYTTASFNIKVLGNVNIDNQNGYITNGLVSNELRVVLSWGYSPFDLDSHMVGPNSDNGRFHVFFKDKVDESVMLDVDDITSYGPETITVSEQYDGKYTYAVHDYTNQSNPSSTALSNSGAQVVVYLGMMPIQQYYVPTDKIGTLWTVFEYDSRTKRIKTINTFSNQNDADDVLYNASIR